MTKFEPPTVSDAFQLLAKSTELSLGEYTLITQGQADIEAYLLPHLSTFSTMLYGAFSRKTIVSPLAGSIINMLVVYRDADIKNHYPSRVFSDLATTLTSQYSDAYELENQNVLIIPFNQFLLKLHPAYAVSEHTYMLPDDKFNEWAMYDISAYNDIFIKENVRHKGRLIEIIRIVKTWNRINGNLFNGYYLELLVTDILFHYPIAGYAKTLCHIFGTATREVVFQKQDPANIEIQVEGLNDIDDLIKAMKLLKNSYELSCEALEFEQNGNTEKALEYWNRIFPRTFPTHIDMLVANARRAGITGAEALKMIINQK